MFQSFACYKQLQFQHGFYDPFLHDVLNLEVTIISWPNDILVNNST